MKLAIMQPYFLPYIGYFQMMNAVDRFVIYDDVNYINRGWINRNNFLLNSQSYSFSLPLLKVSQNKRINEIDLLEELKWKKKLLTTLSHAYKKAPNFETVYPLLENILTYKTTKLCALILYSIKQINSYLDIKTELVKSSTKYGNANLRGQTRILDICEKENADIYINPIGGKELYVTDSFRLRNLELKFLKSKEILYPQFKNNFIPNLSILDTLMFNSVEETKKLLDNYTFE